MKTRYYVLFAVCSYLFFTLATTPAAAVFSLVQKNSQLPFSLHGIDGSLWNGTAERITIPSAPKLTQLSWSLNPFALLLARVNASVETDILDNKLTGNISVNSSGELSGSDIQTRLQGKVVQQLLDLPLGEIDGDFNINIESFELASTLPAIKGNVQWNKARFTLADTVELGNVDIKIKPADNNTMNISINNQGGNLSVEGSIVLMENKNYKLNLTFKPQANANNNIKQSLAMFAKRQSNGSYILKQNGNLRSLGF